MIEKANKVYEKGKKKVRSLKGIPESNLYRNVPNRQSHVRKVSSINSKVKSKGWKL